MRHYGIDMVSTDEEQRAFVELFAPALAVLFKKMGFQLTYSINGKVTSLEAKQIEKAD